MFDSEKGWTQDKAEQWVDTQTNIAENSVKPQEKLESKPEPRKFWMHMKSAKESLASLFTVTCSSDGAEKVLQNCAGDDGCSTYAGSQNKGEKVGAGK